MPYDWEGNWVESKADRHADSLGIGEIGGIGQLIYRAVRFKEYEYIDGSGMQWLAHPVCNKKSPPEIDPEDEVLSDPDDPLPMAINAKITTARITLNDLISLFISSSELVCYR